LIPVISKFGAPSKSVPASAAISDSVYFLGSFIITKIKKG
jgi:hypothetical protein